MNLFGEIHACTPYGPAYADRSEVLSTTGLQLTNYVIAPESTVGKYGKIGKLARHAEISYALAYVFAMFAASPAPIMESTGEAAKGRLHYGCWGGGKRSKNTSKRI